MVATTLPATPPSRRDDRTISRGRSRRIVPVALDRIGPSWFASVMGTGIFAIGLQIAPGNFLLMHDLAIAIFVLDALLFVAFSALSLARYVRTPGDFRASLDDVALAQAWGAPPMACFTIAAGSLFIGTTFVPAGVCVAIAQAVYVCGVVSSLFSAGAVPFRMFTQHEIPPNGAVGSWLLPVVPPIVASVPAALLSPSWPEALRPSMLVLAYALLGIGLALAAIVTVVFYARMLYAKVPEATLVTTTWLVIGPLGQSVAGALALGTAAGGVFPHLGHALYEAAIAYGLLTWGFGCYWLAMAIALTIRAARKHLPFALGWWAFTFPVGTLMSASFGLARATGAVVFEIAGVLLLLLLGAMWALVGARSLQHSATALAAPPRDGVPCST